MKNLDPYNSSVANSMLLVLRSGSSSSGRTRLQVPKWGLLRQFQGFPY